jgi:hypothetical protein
VHVLYYGDHDPLFLEIPLKAQGLATKEIVEHISCGLGHKEVYAYMYWVDRYMTVMGMCWGMSSCDINRMMDIVASTRHGVVQEDSVISSSVQGYVMRKISLWLGVNHNRQK